MILPLLRDGGRRAAVLALALLLSACGGGTGSNDRPTPASTTRKQAMTAAEPSAATDLRVVALTKVGEVRVSRTVYDYVFRVTVRNAASVPFEGVTLQMTGVGAGSSIVDGQVAIATIGAGAELSATDTVTIRHDRLQPFDPAAITWRIDGSVPAAARIAALEASGAIPRLERGSDIAGPDGNGDGVRDDVATWIEQNVTGSPQRAAAMQFSRAMRLAMTTNTADVIQVKAVNRQLSYAIHCVYARFAPPPQGERAPAQVVQELESISTNTKPRLLAYLAFAKALDGTAWSMPEGDTCE